jgi:lipopolysaccharide/colanic/teichoic acid biosynthesis glycosyltransferase
VTRVGKLLRRTRLDELPQLFNVIRGEMRLVGPRPERPYFVEKLATGVPEYRRRLTVPPGITGLAQVERAYDEDLDDVRTKLRYDLFYIENRRALLDMKILMKTLSVVLGRRGAR